MLLFDWLPPKKATTATALRGAHLLGADGVPVRGEVKIKAGRITCECRHDEPLALSLLWPVADFGLVQLETTRLPARDEPYLLNVELVRHRLMRISQKCEEWGLFDYPGMEEISAAVKAAGHLFVAALEHSDDAPRAAKHADEALSKACVASEQMCVFHAGVFLDRRRQSGGLTKAVFGVLLPPELGSIKLDGPTSTLTDFVCVPFTWQRIQPKEQGASYAATDSTVRAARKAGLAVRGGPLLNFGVSTVPPWLVIWENDYEAIAEFARDHVQRTVKRYAGKVSSWVVASGVHTDAVFPFTFEQIMDLTRMAASTAKQTDSRAQIVLEITQPWSEYYARNQSTIPALLYAEMAAQSGISFDVFGLQILFGVDSGGFHYRDLFQVSALIDRIANLGKPLQITAVAVPASGDARGYWLAPWTQASQADWLEAFCRIALSKPYVESVCIHGLTDAAAPHVPGAGLLNDDGSPRPALEQLARLRRTLRSRGKA